MNKLRQLDKNIIYHPEDSRPGNPGREFKIILQNSGKPVSKPRSLSDPKSMILTLGKASCGSQS